MSSFPPPPQNVPPVIVQAPKSGLTAGKVILFVCGGFLLLCFVMCGGCLLLLGGSAAVVESQNQATRQQIVTGGGEVMKVSSVQILADYEANELAADTKYEGKILEVTGNVDDVGRDLMESPYLTFATGDFQIISVQCYFDESLVQRVSSLRKGERVTVRGRCDGKFGNVFVKDCIFVE